MKRSILPLIMFFLLAGFLAFQKTVSSYSDIFSDLGIERSDANEWITSNMINGELYFVFTDQMKKLSPEKRTAMVKILGDHIRSQVETPEFAERYKAKRAEEMAMANGDQSGPSKEEMLSQFIENMEQNERMQLEVMKGVTGTKKAEMEISLKEIRHILSVLKDRKHPEFNKVFNEMKEEQYPSGNQVKYDDPGEAKAAAEMEKQIQKDLLEQYPPTAKGMIAKRLKEFIDITGTIDFNARLEKRGNKFYFADPRYEAKDGNWKALFRCGKEVILPARAYAQQWLAGIK